MYRVHLTHLNVKSSDSYIAATTNSTVHYISATIEYKLGNASVTSSRYLLFFQCTIGPLIIELLLAKKRVSTRALGALDAPLVVQTKV